MRHVLILAAAALSLGACIGGDHVAYVGFREGDKVLWDTWQTASRADCNEQAVARYNAYFRQGRAVDRYCMHNGERYR